MKRTLPKVLKRGVTVRLSETASALIQTASERAKRAETGGLLLGWWEKNTIVIADALEVFDSSATAASWTRRQSNSQKALDAALTASANANIGYVGDWHCHPAPVGASDTDLQSLARSSTEYPSPLALVVRQADGLLRVYVGDQGRLRTVRVTS